MILGRVVAALDFENHFRAKTIGNCLGFGCGCKYALVRLTGCVSHAWRAALCIQRLRVQLYARKTNNATEKAGNTQSKNHKKTA